jgi:YVTN family beta-propeller protein
LEINIFIQTDPERKTAMITPDHLRSASRIAAAIRTLFSLLVLASLVLTPGKNAQALPVILATIPVSGAHSVIPGINPTTNLLYVGDSDIGSLSVVDMTTNTVVDTISGLKANVSDGPVDISVNPSTNFIYVGRTVHFGGRISVIDGATNQLGTIAGLGSHPVSLAVNALTNRIYVANQLGNTVSVIDGATNTVISTISGFSSPIGVAVNPVTNLIYIGNNGANSLAVVDGNTNTIIMTIALGAGPFRVAVDPVMNRIYASHPSNNSVSVIDGSSNSFITAIAVGSSPLGIAVNPNNGRIYTADYGSDAVSIIDGNTDALVTTVAVGHNPAGVGVNPATGRIYVTNSASNTVSVLEDIVDNTPPKVDVSFAAPDGLNGWFVSSPVTGTVSADDSSTGGSHVTAVHCTGAAVGSITGTGTPSASASLTVSTEGVNHVSCTATDNFGNSGAAAGSNNTATVMLDRVDPAVAIVSPPDGGTYFLNAAAVSDYTCSDDTSGVQTCTGPVADGAGFDTSAVGLHTFIVTSNDVAGNSGQAMSTYNVNYSFAGFFQPVDNLPVLNLVKGGQAVPVKFSLGGAQGLDIFEATYPRSQQVACDSTAPVDGIEETVTAGSSSLSYDPRTDTYTYVWKTEKGWSGACLQLVVKLMDGSFHRANFKFK